MEINLKDLAGGALQENAAKAIEEVVQNMQDPNTPWKNKREVVIKLKFIQNEDRDDATCEVSVEKKLAPVKPVATKFALGTDLDTGKVYAQEYGPGIKGQMTINDIMADGSGETLVDGKTVDTETGEIIGDTNKVIDLRAKQA